MGNTGRASMMTARGFRDSAFFHLHQEEAIDAQDEAEWNIVLSLSGRFAARALLAEPPSLPSPSPARDTAPPSFREEAHRVLGEEMPHGCPAAAPR